MVGSAYVVLAVASAGNAALWYVDRDPDRFDLSISGLSVVVAVLILAALYLNSGWLRMNAAWLASGVWTATAVEVSVNADLRGWTRFRNGMIFGALTLLSIVLYTYEHRRREAMTT
jgi:hypothetical protein